MCDANLKIHIQCLTVTYRLDNSHRLLNQPLRCSTTLTLTLTAVSPTTLSYLTASTANLYDNIIHHFCFYIIIMHHALPFLDVHLLLPSHSLSPAFIAARGNLIWPKLALSGSWQHHLCHNNTIY